MVDRGRRRDRGQAALEYLAVLAVAGVALTVGVGAAMARGGGVASAVRAQMVRALCIVTAGDCDRDRAPCVRRSRRTADGGHLDLLLVRVGKDHVALLEERSDERFDVTLVDAWQAGPQAGVGAGGFVRWGSGGAAVRGELRAALLAHEGRGRTWTVGSRQEAEALVGSISGVRAALLPQAIRGGALPPPDQTFYEHGWGVTLTGYAGRGMRRTGRLTIAARDIDGARHDRRTGHETLYLARSSGLSGELDAASGGSLRGGSVAGAAEGEHVWAIETDGNGRPLDLMILSTGEYAGSFSLPTRLQRVAGFLAAPAKDARRYEAEVHLDLTDPENLASATAFLDAVWSGAPRPGRDRVPVSDRLAARIEGHAVIHARTYAVDGRSYGAGGRVAAGGGVGGAAGREVQTARLLAAVTRGPDGTWQQRTDCITA